VSKDRHGIEIVLVAPEIPPNTGSIARLCAATRTRLHLIRPLGFSLEDRYLKRAGLDYWPWVDLRVHDDWPAFLAARSPARLFCYSARARASFLAAPYEVDGALHLVFGGETRGLPPSIVNAHGAAVYRIPIFEPRVRSLNLANAVAVALYEGLRRRGALPQGG
jgi:tRNA (cytidine/uridine-2'-O-)-methyltransferase